MSVSKHILDGLPSEFVPIVRAAFSSYAEICLSWSTSMINEFVTDFVSAESQIRRPTSRFPHLESNPLNFASNLANLHPKRIYAGVKCNSFFADWTRRLPSGTKLLRKFAIVQNSQSP